MSTMGQQLAQSFGIGLAAMLLSALSGGGKLTTATIAPAFFAIGAISLVSLAFFLPLPRNAGAELHGLPARRGPIAGQKA
jgi:hypothetical protein